MGHRLEFNQHPPADIRRGRVEMTTIPGNELEIAFIDKQMMGYHLVRVRQAYLGKGAFVKRCGLPAGHVGRSVEPIGVEVQFDPV